MTTTEVDNWPGDVEGLQGPDLMERMRRHAERFNTEIVERPHPHRDAARSDRSCWRATPAHYTCDALIIATGASAQVPRPASPRRRFKGKGVSACATCDGFFFRGQQRRGDRRRQHGRRGSAVPVEHRRACHAGAPARPAAQREDPAGPPVGARGRGKVSIRWNHAVDEVLGDDSRRHRPAHPRHRWHGSHRRDLPVTGVFIAIGHTPNTEPLRGPARHAAAATSGAQRHRRQCHRDQRRGRVRRRRRGRPRLSPGHHLGRLRLHGGARRRPLPGTLRRRPTADARRQLDGRERAAGALDLRTDVVQRMSALAPPNGMRWPAAPARSCATSSSPRSSMPAASGPGTGWTPRIWRCATRPAGRGRAGLRQVAFLGRIRVRLRLGAGLCARTACAYYPKLLVAVPFTPANGAAAAVRPDRDRRRRRAARCSSAVTAARRGEPALSAHALFIDARDREAARGAGLAAAPRLPVPLAQPRLRAISRPSSAPSRPTSARRRGASGAASPKPASASRPAARQRARRARTAASRLRPACRDTFLRHGHEPYLNPRLLRRSWRARSATR